MPVTKQRLGRFSRMRLCALVTFGIGLLQPASAGTIDISNNSGNWTVSAAGAIDATPFIFGGGGLSFTSDARRTGTFVTGASLANFTGFWTANLDFFVPADATNLTLTFSHLSADDRVVLGLLTGPDTGVELGNAGLNVPASGTLNGSMRFDEGGIDEPYTFSGSASAGTVTGPFTLGATNHLIAILNNTGSGAVGITRTFAGDGDGAVFRLRGSVDFTQVPEPSGMGIAGICLLAVAAIRRKDWRQAP